MKRRAIWHDYRARSLYMLTFTTEPNSPKLSHVELHNGSVILTLTELGKKIASEIKSIPTFHPQIRLYDSVVMPDHIHFIIFVTEPIPHPLGQEIAGFITACNLHYGQRLFTPGFHDRIIMRPGQLDTARHYISDNPRRLCIRRMRPDLFRRYNHIRIGHREFAAYGNIFLLRDFDRRQVVVHRADSQETRAENERQWAMCAANGGVLVSPFISPDEKAMRDRAVALGGNLIIIRNEGFQEKFKPQGHEFDLCCQGRLLLIAPWPEQLKRTVVSRSEALKMNELASFLCECNDDMAIIG